MCKQDTYEQFRRFWFVQHEQDSRDFACWLYDRETLSAFLALCGNPSVIDGFPAQIHDSWDLMFYLLNKLQNKSSGLLWFQAPWCSFFCHCSSLYQSFEFLHRKHEFVAVLNQPPVDWHLQTTLPANLYAANDKYIPVCLLPWCCINRDAVRW